MQAHCEEVGHKDWDGNALRNHHVLNRVEQRLDEEDGEDVEDVELKFSGKTSGAPGGAKQSWGC